MPPSPLKGGVDAALRWEARGGFVCWNWSGDDGVHGEVGGLGGEVGKELEGPAEADEVGGRLTPWPP